MNGLLHHLALTLRLNFRSKQAIVYGYVVPIFFLIAFGVVFRATKPPLIREMGQLITVTILGGACFGMPTSMVAERERGVWRRYRLLPTAIGGMIASAMVARFVIILSAVLLQIILARAFLGTPFPEHPIGMAAAFAFATFAFLGLGLIIAMLADTVPSVQALGQAIFLPMIMVGGVGIPLGKLPPLWQTVAGFFPGRYAVEALQACQKGNGLSGAGFALAALTLIGVSGCVVAVKLFRWDVKQHIAAPAMAWVTVALVVWAGVGLAAQLTGRLKPVSDFAPSGALASMLSGGSNGSPGPTLPNGTTRPAAGTGPATNESVAAAPEAPIRITQAEPWESVTDADIKGIRYDDVPDDNGTEVPLAADLESLDEDGKKRMEDFAEHLAQSPQDKVTDLVQRVRGLLSVCAVTDFLQDQHEAHIPFIVFEHLRNSAEKDKLIKATAYVILHPDEGTVTTKVSDLGLGLETEVDETLCRQRTTLYAKKLLYRLLGKLDQKPAR
jgi:ABC-2 family transporter